MKKSKNMWLNSEIFLSSVLIAAGAIYALHSIAMVSLLYASVIVFVMLTTVSLLPLLIISLETRKPLSWKTLVSSLLGILATFCYMGIGELLRVGTSFETSFLCAFVAFAALSSWGVFVFYKEAAQDVIDRNTRDDMAQLKDIFGLDEQTVLIFRNQDSPNRESIRRLVITKLVSMAAEVEELAKKSEDPASENFQDEALSFENKLEDFRTAEGLVVRAGFAPHHLSYKEYAKMKNEYT